jgi:hypothetical protein
MVHATPSVDVVLPFLSAILGPRKRDLHGVGTAAPEFASVAFSKVTGALASRNVSVLATDILGNVSVTTLPIKVGP